jgi:hypothetical protein
LEGITDGMKQVAAMPNLSECLSRISKFKAWTFSKSIISNYQFSIIMSRCVSMEGLSVISKSTERDFQITVENINGINTASSIISNPFINLMCISFKANFYLKTALTYKITPRR